MVSDKGLYKMTTHVRPYIYIVKQHKTYLADILGLALHWVVELPGVSRRTASMSTQSDTSPGAVTLPL